MIRMDYQASSMNVMTTFFTSADLSAWNCKISCLKLSVNIT